MGVTRIMFTLLSLCLFLCSTLVTAISPISAKGTKLYDNDGNQFFIKGVAYVPGAGRSDPLVDAKQCKTDAALIKQLGANTIYVYSVDVRDNHDGCMKEFADQGIYVWLQMGGFPRATETTTEGPQWTKSVFSAWTDVLDVFAGYDNVLSLGIGQETITESSDSTVVAPSLKAAARDLRAYREAQGYRPIPLSYSIADAAAFRAATAQYLACGDDPDETIDLIGLNIFLQCARADWLDLASQVRNIPVPVAISESGCRGEDNSRNFSEVAMVLGQELNDVFSGISIYEWAMQDTPSFGIVQYANDARTGIPKTLPQYTSLQDIFSAAAKSTGTPAASYTPSSASSLACPTKDADAGWLVDPSAALPTIAGLQITKGTGTGTGNSRETSPPDTNNSQTDSNSSTNLPATTNTSSPSLSGRAIAGIVIGVVLFAVLLAVGILLCIRRRRALAASAAHTEVHHHHHHHHALELPPNTIHDQPPSYNYPYPPDKVELPTHNMAAIEMDDGTPRSVSATSSTTRPSWNFLPTQGGGGNGGRDDSPTVAAVPEGSDRRWWRRTRQYELEDTPATGAGISGTGSGTMSGTMTGTFNGSWVVSPVTPQGGPGKYA